MLWAPMCARRRGTTEYHKTNLTRQKEGFKRQLEKSSLNSKDMLSEKKASITLTGKIEGKRSRGSNAWRTWEVWANGWQNDHRMKKDQEPLDSNCRKQLGTEKSGNPWSPTSWKDRAHKERGREDLGSATWIHPIDVFCVATLYYTTPYLSFSWWVKIWHLRVRVDIVKIPFERFAVQSLP